jgi:hypothetical protein
MQNFYGSTNHFPADKGSRASFGRVVKEGGCFGNFDQTAIEKKSRSMGQPLGLKDVMGYENHGGTLRLVDQGDNLLD